MMAAGSIMAGMMMLRKKEKEEKEEKEGGCVISTIFIKIMKELATAQDFFPLESMALDERERKTRGRPQS